MMFTAQGSSRINRGIKSGASVYIFSCSMFTLAKKAAEKTIFPGARAVSYHASSSGQPNNGVHDQNGHPVIAQVTCSKEFCVENLCSQTCEASQGEKDIGNLTKKLPKNNCNKGVIEHRSSKTYALIKPESQARDHPPGTISPDGKNTSVIKDMQEDLHNHVAP